MSGYVVAVGEIEKPITITTIAIGKPGDVWNFGDTADVFTKADNKWVDVILLRPLNAQVKIIPKHVIAWNKEDEPARIRVVGGVTVLTGTPVWVTKGNAQYSVSGTTTFSFGNDITIPMICNKQQRIDTPIPYDRELGYTTTGEIMVVMARNIGAIVNVWASLAWIERSAS